ncbi:hypothetical protein PVAG01_09366 [Phlyctema vagabunda]|uniref:Uncharacterized protein n=1 Tax=Phlyctema vagabunda TaxID=108571 RepID=A0ABR4P771_9HELO
MSAETDQAKKAISPVENKVVPAKRKHLDSEDAEGELSEAPGLVNSDSDKEIESEGRFSHELSDASMEAAADASSEGSQSDRDICEKNSKEQPSERLHDRLLGKRDSLKSTGPEKLSSFLRRIDSIKKYRSFMIKGSGENESIEQTYKKAIAEIMENSGLTISLYDEFLAFGKSFEQRSSFSLRSDKSTYDQDGIMTAELKDLLGDMNFRAEDGPNIEFKEKGYDTCVFGIVKFKEFNGDKNLTWGEKYPELYKLAMNATRQGSEIALELLVRLPDRDATCSGGWLLKHENKSRWSSLDGCAEDHKLLSAHNIAAPHDPDIKRQELMRILQPNQQP